MLVQATHAEVGLALLISLAPGALAVLVVDPREHDHLAGCLVTKEQAVLRPTVAASNTAISPHHQHLTPQRRKLIRRAPAACGSHIARHQQDVPRAGVGGLQHLP